MTLSIRQSDSRSNQHVCRRGITYKVDEDEDSDDQDESEDCLL